MACLSFLGMKVCGGCIGGLALRYVLSESICTLESCGVIALCHKNNHTERGLPGKEERVIEVYLKR